MSLTINVNGQPREWTGRSDLSLLDLLRDEFGITGPKAGCREGRTGSSSKRSGVSAGFCVLQEISERRCRKRPNSRNCRNERGARAVGANDADKKEAENSRANRSMMFLR